MTTAPVLTITEELVAELEVAANKATQVGWVRNRSFGQLSVQDDSYMLGDEDAEFIAKANPRTILALLAERAELKRDAELYRFVRDESDFDQWQRLASCLPDEWAAEIESMMQERQE